MESCLLLWNNWKMYFKNFIKLYAFKVLQNNIDWVLSLVNTLEFHDAKMINVAHQVNFILERISPFVTRILLFFGKGLDGDHFLISESLGQINCSKGAFTDFLFCLEKFMKISLIDFLFQFFHPQIQHSRMLIVEGDFLCTIFSLEFQSQRLIKVKLDLLLLNKK